MGSTKPNFGKLGYGILPLENLFKKEFEVSDDSFITQSKVTYSHKCAYPGVKDYLYKDNVGAQEKILYSNDTNFQYDNIESINNRIKKNIIDQQEKYMDGYVEC